MVCSLVNLIENLDALTEVLSLIKNQNMNPIEGENKPSDLDCLTSVTPTAVTPAQSRISEKRSVNLKASFGSSVKNLW